MLEFSSRLWIFIIFLMEKKPFLTFVKFRLIQRVFLCTRLTRIHSHCSLRSDFNPSFPTQESQWIAIFPLLGHQWIDIARNFSVRATSVGCHTIGIASGRSQCKWRVGRDWRADVWSESHYVTFHNILGRRKWWRIEKIKSMCNEIHHYFILNRKL